MKRMAEDLAETETKGASPTATGPGGSLFEGEIGAVYLLSLLTGSEPRGLPGHGVTRIKFQRGDEGHPLDDVIIDAQSPEGGSLGLDIQVKRTITFAPGDAVFRKVMGQIADSLKPGMPADRRFGIVTASMSRKIAGPLQDVLTWARAVDNPAVFHARLTRKGVAGPDMSSFIATVRDHLAALGSDASDRAVWALLRRLSIMVYDFASPDSATLQLARHQCAQALPEGDTGLAGALWSALIEIALKRAAAGGDIDRDGLLAELSLRGFRFEAHRRNGTARQRLAEDTALAIASIDDTVGGAVLYRPERLAEIHAGLDVARYLEIRGAGGVGKSGLLKHLADSVGAEGTVIVLSPNRIPARGWAAFRDRIGYDGTAADLVNDVALGGGGLLLIDNIEGFSAEERMTVVDLVNEAAKGRGLSVVVTCRPEFGGDDQPNWLPQTAIERLGRAPRVVIGDLTDDERADLRRAAPTLATLLGSHHPARAIVGNLYRLKRLAALDADEAVKTEVELAQRWWRQADGGLDGRRARSRLLETLAKQIVGGVERHDISAVDDTIIDSLIASETLLELDSRHVVFRHDVLRDWAVFNWLAEDPERIHSLGLARLAPARLVRGLELLSRQTLAANDDDAAWTSLLSRVSAPEMHGSWRRAVLLAIVRADDAVEQLRRLKPRLLADDGALLVELIRLVVAVEVQPAGGFFSALGVDITLLPDGMTVPNGPAWQALITVIPSWFGELPPKSAPAVVDLYQRWLMAFGGVLRGSDVLVRQVYDWMTRLGPADRSTVRGGAGWFNGLESHELEALAVNLRSTFVAFAALTPDLARQYISDLKAGRNSSEGVKAALAFAGGLPQAVPSEYADLFLHALLEPLGSSSQRERRRGRGREEPFTFLDHDFIPESPGKGPFVALLRAAPHVALDLARALVDHEIAWHLDGASPAVDFKTGVGDVKRAFTAGWSYEFARHGARGHATRCALMAVEAWGHGRIETGETIGAVIKDIWGVDGDLPAPFALLAVDLALSHSDDTSARVLLDLIASPELLGLDLRRQGSERMGGMPDLFDFAWLRKKEPGQGGFTAKSLANRGSRSITLRQVVPPFVFRDAEHAVLSDHYAKEVVRLGAPKAHAGFADPAFVAAHVLSLLDRKNWAPLNDGSNRLVFQTPAAELEHLQRLQDQFPDRDFQLDMILSRVVDKPDTQPDDVVRAALGRLRKPRAAAADSALDSDRQSRAQAAYLVSRDATEDLWLDVGAEVTAELVGEDERDDDHFGGSFSLLQYNPPGLAFLGLSHAFQRNPDRAAAERLLRAASGGGLAAAQAFGRSVEVIAAADPRLPVSLLRCALVGARSARRPYWDEDESRFVEISDRIQLDRARAVEAELGWLFDGQAEPAWPEAVARKRHPRRRSGVRLGRKADEQPSPSADPDLVPAPAGVPEEGPEYEYFHHQAAGAWVSGALQMSDDRWLDGFVDAWLNWTFVLNGLGLEPSDELNREPDGWNGAFFAALGRTLSRWTPERFESSVALPFSRLPDRSILTVAPLLLDGIDMAVFKHHAMGAEAGAYYRAEIAAVVMTTRGWRNMIGKFSTSIEMTLGPAAASLFFADHVFGQGVVTRLYAPALERLDPYLPQLEKQVSACPSYYVALAVLSLVEVAPRPAFLALLLTAGEVWLAAFPGNTVFWVENAIGRRLCRLFEALLMEGPGFFAIETPERLRLETILAKLIALGVADASRIESLLNV